MSLIKSITTIASSSALSQIIGAASIWAISHFFGIAQVGEYALTYSLVLIGAQLCTFASQLLLPKQDENELSQNVVFCILQSMIIALLFSVIVSAIYGKNIVILYSLTLSHALVLVSENLLLRDEKINFLVLQRLSISLWVFISVFIANKIQVFYELWAIGLSVIIILWLYSSVIKIPVSITMFSIKKNMQFFMKHKAHLGGVGSAEVLAMANSNLPMILIGYWFAPVTAGYFAVVSRFCLSPVFIVGNAVRNSVFSKWSIDFRHNRFNYDEFAKVRKLLLVLGIVATIGVFIFYPIVIQFAFSQEWIDSIPTSRYMLPYLFPALAICPLTVLELVYGSPKYFLRIQIEQLFVIFIAFIVLPLVIKNYDYSVLIYAILSFIRYGFIYIKVNNRAVWLKKEAGSNCDN
ncbi:TPA: lipopolysaccharide biosynthesis protein [Photobacterium damselae]